MKNINGPVYLSVAAFIVAIVSLAVSHYLHWYVASICLSAGSMASAVGGIIWAIRKHLAVLRQIDEQIRRRR